MRKWFYFFEVSVENYNQIVVKHNALVEAKYKLSLYESRLFLTCLSQVNSMGELDTNDIFIVTVKDVVELCEVSNNTAYRHLKEAADGLMRQQLFINVANKKRQKKINWVSSAEYDERGGAIYIKFTADFIPYISQLRRDFTQYRLENILKFKSVYSIRIYELVVKWEGKQKEIALDWLKDKFQIEDKYSKIGDLKKYILDVAVKEINEHSDMKVSYTQVKRGRNIVGFIFKYQPKTKKKPNGISKKEIEKHARPGETHQQVKDRLLKLM